MPRADFSGRRALVTGAGRGIGRAVALELAAAGATVTAMSRSEADLDSLASAASESAGRVIPWPGDVRASARIAEAVAASEPDLLVTAAGINRPGRLDEVSPGAIASIIEVNVLGTLHACRAFGSALIEAGGSGAVVTLSSQMGSVGYPGRVPYCASKHAVNGLTKALALEWAPHGIRVNAVAPTFIRTPLTEPMFADPEFEREVLRRIPLGRIGEVDDVTGAVSFLLGEDAALITGHVLAVDGGWTAQ